MTVGTFRPTNFPTQDPASYKSNIDADFAVATRLIDAFAPHAQSTPNMTVALDAGFIYTPGSLLETTAQNTAAIAASSLAGITRIDRVVVDSITGLNSVITGTSVAPALPAGKNPVARVSISTGTTAITNALIVDERAFPSGITGNYQVFTSTAAGQVWTKPNGYSTNASVVVQMWAGGGGGSSVAGAGGGAGIEFNMKLSDLSTSVSVTVGNGGASGGNDGGNSVFGSVTVYGGDGAPSGFGGGGGGIFGASPGSGVGGAPLGAAVGSTSVYGGGGGGNGTAGGASVYGGGGGGDGGAGLVGGRSFMGGGGGGGHNVGAAAAGGASVLGGNGGNGSTAIGGTGTAGSVPGGGGGNNAAGARGEVRVWVFP